MDILGKLVSYVNEKIDGTEYFIVETKGNKDNNRFQILIDGDKGIGIDVCASISRHVSFRADEENLGDDKFNYEISSPGVDKPLTVLRQYPKNIGRTLLIVTNNGTEHTGKLTAVNADSLELEITTKEKGKKAVIQTETLPFTDIKYAKVKISFK